MHIGIKFKRAKRKTRGKAVRKLHLYSCDTCGVVFERRWLMDNVLGDFCCMPHMHDARWNRKLSLPTITQYADGERVSLPREDTDASAVIGRVKYYNAKTRRWVLHRICVCQTCDVVFETRRSNSALARHTYVCCGDECQKLSLRIGCAGYERQRRTMIARHGVEFIGFRNAKALKTNFERYGNEEPMRTDIVKERLRATLLSTYGVEYASQTEHYKEAFRATCLQRFGATSPLGSPAILAKKLATEKRNGTYRSSKPEDKLHTMLCDRFGCDDVERQVRVCGRRTVDFYITSIDTYVELDGTYWHGLDRPIEVISASVKPRDVAISEKWHADRENDAWFSEHELRLVRVTDDELARDGVDVLSRIVR